MLEESVLPIPCTSFGSVERAAGFSLLDLGIRPRQGRPRTKGVNKLLRYTVS